MKTSALITLCAAALLAATATTARSAEGEYRASALPNHSTPQWSARGDKERTTVSVADEALKGETADGAVVYYTIGTDERGRKLGQTQAWSLDGDSAMVELKLRWSADRPEYEVFRVEISNGERRWVVPFSGDGVVNRRHKVDNSAFDVYRLVLKDGTLSIYSDKRGLLQKGLKPYSTTSANQILFGSFWNKENQHLDAKANWELEYIKWTDNGQQIDKALQK